MNNGDFITNPQFKKVSTRFRFYEPLADSECSEDYDEDVFFEGKAPTDLYMSLAQSEGVTGMGRGPNNNVVHQ